MIAIIIQARFASTRLPGKVLKKVLGKTLLEHLLERVKRSRLADKIIVATTERPEDKKIVAVAKAAGVLAFQGSEQDVLDRYYQAAKEYHADTMVRITGDCPLIDPKVIDQIIGFYTKNKDRFDYVSNVHPPTYPDGLDVEVCSFQTLERVWKEATLPSEREHVTPYIYTHPKTFRVGNVQYKTDISHLRLTVDTEEDLAVVKNILSALSKAQSSDSLEEILTLLERRPDIVVPNAHIVRNEGYLKSVHLEVDFYIRKARKEDSGFLHALRNQDSVRGVSFSTAPIPIRTHLKWFAKQLMDKKSRIYIAEISGEPMAQVRFEIDSLQEAEVHIAVSESFQGKGYGSEILRQASRRFLEDFREAEFIRAFIKPDNQASLRSFKKASYLLQGETEHKGGLCVEMVYARYIHIDKRHIGLGHPCFIVAELSGNHHQRYEEAVALVQAAKEAGADAVKLQTYTPDTITLNSDRKWFRVGGKSNPKNWKGKTLYELYKKAYTPWEWQPKLKKLADTLGITLFSSPFDETAVDFLEKVRVPCYKIASYEATDFVLLRRVARTKKPVIMSIGYASLAEIRFAVETLRKYGTTELALLHCVTGYAAHPKLKEMHLSTIVDIARRFGVVSGFSDNNAGMEIPVLAAQAGASIIEKHLVLRRDGGGVDAQFSLEPSEFREMVDRIRKAEQEGKGKRLSQTVLGKAHYGPLNALERYNTRWRRSLFAGKNIKNGELFTKENVRDVRPAFGLPTKEYDTVIGKRAKRDIAFATPLSWNLIEE